MWLYKNTQTAMLGVCLETAQWSVSVCDSLRLSSCWFCLLPPVLWANRAVDEVLISLSAGADRTQVQQRFP